jgi:hypothetical protein
LPVTLAIFVVSRVFLQPGIGDVNVRTLFAELPELGSLDPRRIAALMDAVRVNQSSGLQRGHRYRRRQHLGTNALFGPLGRRPAQPSASGVLSSLARP